MVSVGNAERAYNDMMYGDNVYKYISKSYMVNNPIPSFVSLFTFCFKGTQLSENGMKDLSIGHFICTL